MERNLLLTIEYDGSGFSGWQRQPDRRTVQGTLEEALGRVLGQAVQIQGTSRTDSGVHALGQQATLRGDFGIPTDKLMPAVNNILAGRSGGIGRIGRVGDVRLTAVREMPPGFHARFDAVGKLYRYLLSERETPDIFRRNYCYQLPQVLDLAAMRQAAAQIVGTHDFCCFQSAGGTERETTVRTVYALTLERTEHAEGSQLTMEIRGDGFLYNMVRIITGTLVEVGLGLRSAASVQEILDSGDRQLAGHTAPAAGLYLVRVFYDQTELLAR